jgi:hypothetical protein
VPFVERLEDIVNAALTSGSNKTSFRNAGIWPVERGWPKLGLPKSMPPVVVKRQAFRIDNLLVTLPDVIAAAMAYKKEKEEKKEEEAKRAKDNR